MIVGPDDPSWLALVVKKKFKYRLRGPWLMLSYQIQQWLLDIFREDSEHPLLQWGIELFWIAYIAAFPEFPYGTVWPEWDGYAIPFECGILTNWMNRPRPEIDIVCETREEMWSEVNHRVLLYFGGSV